MATEESARIEELLALPFQPQKWNATPIAANPAATQIVGNNNSRVRIVFTNGSLDVFVLSTTPNPTAGNGINLGPYESIEFDAWEDPDLVQSAWWATSSFGVLTLNWQETLLLV